MRVVAYLRVSRDSQDTNNQKLAILEYARKERCNVDEFVAVNVSSQRSPKERGLNQLLEMLSSGDLLLVSELSRLGRSVGQVVRIVDTLIKRKIGLIAIKENIRISGKMDLQKKVMVTMFGLFAEIERDLISQRTRDGLAAARAAGKKLGRPKGAFSSKLDAHRKEITEWRQKGVSKASLAKMYDVGKSTMAGFLKTRNIP